MSGSSEASRPIPFADRALRASAVFWCVVAAVGIWIFGYYIAALYGVGFVGGDLDRWNRVLPKGHGYVPGDGRGNVALGIHLLMALVVTLGGVVQLIPVVRRRVPALHRWNGRLFITVALIAAATGLYIAFSRGAAAGAGATVRFASALGPAAVRRGVGGLVLPGRNDAVVRRQRRSCRSQRQFHRRVRRVPGLRPRASAAGCAGAFPAGP